MTTHTSTTGPRIKPASAMDTFQGTRETLACFHCEKNKREAQLEKIVDIERNKKALRRGQDVTAIHLIRGRDIGATYHQ